MRPIRLYFSPEPGFSSSQGCSRRGFPRVGRRRSIRWRRCVMNDLKFALRQLIKNPGFTAVAVLTLALGIGANTAMFSVVNAVLLRPLPFKEPARLVTVWERNPKQGYDQNVAAPANFLDWKAQSQSFEQLAMFDVARGYNLTGTDEPARVNGFAVTANLFQTLGVNPAIGRDFSIEEETQGRDR